MFMSRRVLTATVFDSLEFARQGGQIDGVIPLGAMHRVADLLAAGKGDAGEVAVVLRGRRTEEDGGRAGFWLLLSVTGELALTCQRCLGALGYSLRLESRLRLVGESETWPGQNPGDDGWIDAVEDAIPAAAEQTVMELVEDEVLLALPMAPRHERCDAPDEVWREGTTASPFAVLAGLKRKH